MRGRAHTYIISYLCTVLGTCGSMANCLTHRENKYLAGDIDHKTPPCQRDSNDIESLQLICKAEHLEKTAQEHRTLKCVNT